MTIYEKKKRIPDDWGPLWSLHVVFLCLFESVFFCIMVHGKENMPWSVCFYIRKIMLDFSQGLYVPVILLSCLIINQKGFQLRSRSCNPANAAVTRILRRNQGKRWLDNTKPAGFLTLFNDVQHFLIIRRKAPQFANTRKKKAHAPKTNHLDAALLSSTGTYY